MLRSEHPGLVEDLNDPACQGPSLVRDSFLVWVVEGPDASTLADLDGADDTLVPYSADWGVSQFPVP